MLFRSVPQPTSLLDASPQRSTAHKPPRCYSATFHRPPGLLGAIPHPTSLPDAISQRSTASKPPRCYSTGHKPPRCYSTTFRSVQVSQMLFRSVPQLTSLLDKMLFHNDPQATSLLDGISQRSTAHKPSKCYSTCNSTAHKPPRCYSSTFHSPQVSHTLFHMLFHSPQASQTLFRNVPQATSLLDAISRFSFRTTARSSQRVAKTASSAAHAIRHRPAASARTDGVRHPLFLRARGHV